MVVEARGLCKAFGERLLLDDVSFIVPAGSIVGMPPNPMLMFVQSLYKSPHFEDSICVTTIGTAGFPLAGSSTNYLPRLLVQL